MSAVDVRLPMKHVPPEAWRAYAAALAHRQRFGEMPSAEVVAALAKQEGASPAVVLALARFEGYARDGSVVSLAASSYDHPPVTLESGAHAWAILATGCAACVDLRAYYKPSLRIRHADLEHWACCQEIGVDRPRDERPDWH